MASPAVQITTGATITFSSGFFAQILSMSWSGMGNRAVIDTAHLGTTTMRTKLFGTLADPGELEVELHLNPDTTVPVEAVAETCTVTFDSGATWAGSAAMTNFSWSGELEDKMTATATIAFSGDITQTPAS